jgi:hypothetical protein
MLEFDGASQWFALSIHEVTQSAALAALSGKRLQAMSDPKDPKIGKKPSDDESPSSESSGEGKRSGRVSFDSRGNSVWEWQLETGVYSRDVNTQKLKKLDLGDLSIAETAIQKSPLALADEEKAARGGGSNPYDSAASTSQGGFNPYDNARTLGNTFASKPKAERKPLSLDELRKLSETIKQQRKDQKK